jgi:hypothetical protein
VFSGHFHRSIEGFVTFLSLVPSNLLMMKKRVTQDGQSNTQQAAFASGAIMNAIQQISLKLQMGIHPDTDIQPELLRTMWRELSHQRHKALEASSWNGDSSPASTTHPALNRAG